MNTILPANFAEGIEQDKLSQAGTRRTGEGDDDDDDDEEEEDDMSEVTFDTKLLRESTRTRSSSSMRESDGALYNLSITPQKGIPSLSAGDGDGYGYGAGDGFASPSPAPGLGPVAEQKGEGEGQGAVIFEMRASMVEDNEEYSA